MPAFKLLNDEGDLVDSKSFKGEYVLIYFYPKAMTPGCTTQACMITDVMKEFKKRKISVYGISPDDPSKLKKFKEKEKLKFPLLSDPDHKVAESFGCWGEKKFMGRTYDGILRQSFLIGPTGLVLHHMEKVNTKTHHEDILKIFDQIV